MTGLALARRIASPLCTIWLLAGCVAGGGVEPPAEPPRTDAAVAETSFRQAMSLARDGRIAAAAPHYRTAADNGHVQAQYILGTMFRTGRGVTRDMAAAAGYYGRAAAGGSPWAQFSLGNMYIKGEGVSRDVSQGVALYRLAAQQHHREAQYNLGAMYYNGDGVEQNYATAEHWFDQAARQGDSWSQFALGRMYSTPHYGVRLDRVRAHAWFSLAAANGHVEAEEEKRRLDARLGAAERAASRALARQLVGEADL